MSQEVESPSHPTHTLPLSPPPPLMAVFVPPSSVRRPRAPSKKAAGLSRGRFHHFSHRKKGACRRRWSGPGCLSEELGAGGGTTGTTTNSTHLEREREQGQGCYGPRTDFSTFMQSKKADQPGRG